MRYNFHPFTQNRYRTSTWKCVDKMTGKETAGKLEKILCPYSQPILKTAIIHNLDEDTELLWYILCNALRRAVKTVKRCSSNCGNPVYYTICILLYRLSKVSNQQ